MESLYFLIPIAFVLLIIAIRLLAWALKSGQYDDLDTEAHRILFDDDPHPTYRGVGPTPVDQPVAMQANVDGPSGEVQSKQASEQESAHPSALSKR